ncbi:universal stress protein, partial [Acinetobacter baumannii]
MYTHVLLAIDGSEFSQRAAIHGLKIAKASGAHATVLNVTRPLSALEISEFGADGEESKLAA